MTIKAESKFVELVRSWLVSLPHDLKIAFDAMDDENLPRPVRELATGVVIYVVSPKDPIADRNDAVVGYADDAVLLRLALHKGLGKGEDEQAFRDRFPELFEGLDDNLKLCKSVMGDLMTWLEKKVSTLRTLAYKGKKLAAYLDDEEAREQLFDDGLVFRTDYPVDEKTIGDKLKKAATIMRRDEAQGRRSPRQGHRGFVAGPSRNADQLAASPRRHSGISRRVARPIRKATDGSCCVGRDAGPGNVH